MLSIPLHIHIQVTYLKIQVGNGSECIYYETALTVQLLIVQKNNQAILGNIKQNALTNYMYYIELHKEKNLVVHPE